MARFFITGSSDGLGALTAKKLIEQGHQVVLHARNAQRAKDAQAACPGSEAVLVGDLASLEQTKQLAAEANKLGPFDAVVHNAGIMHGRGIFAINTLAPYVLACLMDRPQRLVWVSSGMHRGGRVELDRLAAAGYGDTKLHDVMLAKAFARRWPDVQSNAANPGWVPTKMGGYSAPGDINVGVDTFVMLALGEGAAKGVTGKYFTSSKVDKSAKLGDDVGLQDQLIEKLEELSGVSLPGSS